MILYNFFTVFMNFIVEYSDVSRIRETYVPAVFGSAVEVYLLLNHQQYIEQNTGIKQEKILFAMQENHITFNKIFNQKMNLHELLYQEKIN